LGWTELGAYRALWGFIYQHDSQVQEIDCWLPADDPLPLIASDPEFEEHRVVPELMARVVDVKTAVEETPVKDTVAAELKHEPFCLELTDPVIEENCGSFRVSMVRSSQRLECTRTAGPGKLPTAKLSINALAQLISGFLSAQRLAALDKMELSTPELAPVLEALWPRANQYLSEPF
jgi:predicted acetyltransferase